MTNDTTWGVTLSVLEPTQLVVANIAHHLELGAQEVIVFLDKPQKDLEKILSSHPRVTTFVCNSRHWLGRLHTRRPNKVIIRQIRNARYAMTRTKVDWLLHLDADEFLFPKGDFSAELAALPDTFGGLWLENYERAFREGKDQDTIFDGVFRVFPKTDPAAVALPALSSLYGNNTAFARNGFTAHNLGKSFARNDPRYAQGIHQVRMATDENPQPLAKMYCSTMARILHFDGLTRLHWVRKLVRMATEQGSAGAIQAQARRTTREFQLGMIREQLDDPKYLIGVHDAHKVVSPEQEQKLGALGLLQTLAFGPTEAIRRQFPDAGVDLSQKTFDRALLETNEALKPIFSEIYG